MSYTPIVVDTESTTFQTGNPFSKRNRLMCIGTYSIKEDQYWYRPIEHNGLPYNKQCRMTKAYLTNNNPIIIGFNLKYDIHWLRRYIPDLKIKKVWDCQLAQFIINDQTTRYPSLNDCLAQYGLPQKDERIKVEYWDRGIDTDQVPEELLREYNQKDCELTAALYEKQVPLLTGNKLRLFELHCADLLVLEEMEFRGLMYDTKQSISEALTVGQELSAVIVKLDELIGRNDVNWNSPKQVSAILYGGSISFPCRVPTERTLKDGTIKRGERNGHLDESFVRLVEPCDGTENANGWSTDEDTLRSLNATGKAKEIISLVLKQSELDKLVGTYYNGLPDLITQMDWELDTLHGNINQVVAKTGRTSSSQPNLQNFDGRLKPLFFSRFA